MTVLLDPGNVTESYLDHASRMWRNTAGLWLTSSDLWQSRANAAWGTSQVWNSGTSYLADYGGVVTERDTWHSRADSGWGPNRVWNSGQSWEALYNAEVTLYNNQTSAYNTEVGLYNDMVTQRDTWIGYAHSDANVWDNRYNAGHAQGVIDETPAGLSVYSVGTGGAFSGTIGTVTVQRTGQYVVTWNNSSSADGSGAHWVNYTLTVAGTAVATNIPTAIGSGVGSYAGGFWQGHINAGQSVVLSASQNGSASNGGGTLAAYFIPTPSELR